MNLVARHLYIINTVSCAGDSRAYGRRPPSVKIASGTLSTLRHANGLSGPIYPFDSDMDSQQRSVYVPL